MEATYRLVVLQWNGTAKGNSVVFSESGIPTEDMAREHAAEVVNRGTPEQWRRGFISRTNAPFLDKHIATIENT